MDLISDKCWFCKNQFEIDDYNETFQCHQHDYIITLRLNIDETFLISFFNGYALWVWYSEDLNTASCYIKESSDDIPVDISILKLVNQNIEDVNSQLQLIELFS